MIEALLAAVALPPLAAWLALDGRVTRKSPGSGSHPRLARVRCKPLLLLLLLLLMLVV